MNTTIGFIGLGKMGKNMVLHLLEQGVDVVGYNRTSVVTEKFNSEEVKQFKGQGTVGTFIPVFSIEELLQNLNSPRIIFLMVPNGNPVDDVLSQLLSAGLKKGDTVIDGGNVYYKDTIRRHNELKENGITFIDCGTSGGLDGARNGACLMLGGAEQQVRNLAWLWNMLSGASEEITAKSPEALAKGERRGSWGYFGPPGAGHYVKMVHNGIEYGMDQAIGEGIEVLKKGPYTIDLAKASRVWQHGSVIRSWLVELLTKALTADPNLDTYSGSVGGGQTGTWTVEEAKEIGVQIPIIQGALSARNSSQATPTFAGKVVSALRAGYGGHGKK